MKARDVSSSVGQWQFTKVVDRRNSVKIKQLEAKHTSVQEKEL
jgi:hypothetical protein